MKTVKKRRTFAVGLGAVALVGTLAACTPETEVTEADNSGVPEKDLVGETMTHEIQHVLPNGVVTVGENDTIVITNEVPEGTTTGDEMEITGTVELRDVYQAEDIEALRTASDEETATALINRGEELVLVEAELTPVD